ncbi:MAG TPA: CPBP family glutamic-type intramembrane protease [Myxococcota bacterium]|nr:CPBP family glutamic-type intramembrane protease [Myxococcota bacterium]
MGLEPDGQADPPRLVRTATLFYGLLLVGALLWAWLDERSVWFASPEAAERGVHWPRDVALGLVTGAALVLASRALTAASAAGRALAEQLARLLGPLGWGASLALAALSGVAEEAFFRGALQPQLGLVGASLCFAAAHFVPRRAFLPWPVFAFAAGLAFGALFAWTGNLVAAVVAHAGVNALNLRWLGSRPN